MIPSNGKKKNSVDARKIKDEARGHWRQILTSAGIPEQSLDGRGHPCPKCGGKDRFCAFKDFNDTGGVMCRQCFAQKNGDGLAAVQWFHGCSFADAVAWVAAQVGMEANGPSGTGNIIADVARAKHMPVEAFRQFGATPSKRGKKTVARVPVYNERGEQHSYFDLTAESKGWFKGRKGNSGLFFPGRLPDRGKVWLIVEGVKDAAALVGLGFHAAGLPGKQMDVKYSRLFTGVDVVLIPDLDTPGEHGANRTAARLDGIAASVRIARLPGETRPAGGDDVRDVLRRDGEQAVRDAVDQAEVWEPHDFGEGRPVVIVTDDEATVAEEVVSHLAEFQWRNAPTGDKSAERFRVFQRLGELVEVVCDDSPAKSGITLPESVPAIRPLPRALVRERITQCVRLVKEQEQSNGQVVEAAIPPPEWLTQSIHQRGTYSGVRPLAGIVRTPTLKPDGTVVQTRGYDDETGLLYLPDGDFPSVPEEPWEVEAAAAAQELINVVADFPFESDAHRSIWLASVLTLLARPAINGPCPLFAFDANVRGSGKSLLADVASIIATGSPMARMAWAGNDRETEKSITAVVIEGWRAVLFDNITTLLGGSSLEAALTGIIWQGRILGESKTTGNLPLTTVWLASGNNLQLSGDTARRTLLCRLSSLEENPEDRSDFSHPNLKEHVKNHRARLAVAGLTILRGYFAVGCPDMEIPTWGSFEAWSDLIRQAIVWSGQPDPWLTRESMRDIDQSAEILGLLLQGIDEADVDGTGLTSADISRIVNSPVGPDEGDTNVALRIAIEELSNGRNVTSRSVGYGLKRFKERVHQGRRLVNRPGHAGVKKWHVEELKSRSPLTGGEGADGGDEIHNPREKTDESYEYGL